MESDPKYLRQLEARIRTLETENEALRAALQDKSAPSQKGLDDTGVTKTANNDSPAGQLTSHNDQIQTESITLKPERFDCFELALQVARIFMHAGGKIVTAVKTVMRLCAQTNGVMVFVKNQIFVAMSAVIGLLSLSPTLSCVNI